jgi:ABC-2 type transport system permease protein
VNPALLRAELRRVARTRRLLVVAAVLPGIFFVVFTAGDDAERIGDLAVAPYVMVSMATYGAMNALFTGGGVVAVERAVGWSRQLRVTGLRGRDYVLTKIVVNYLTAGLGVVVVFVIGATVKGVHLGPATWAAIGASVLLSLLPVAALGLLVGYLAPPQSLQALYGIGSALLALSGGLWNPIEHFPAPLRTAMRALPVYWAGDAGRAVLRGTWLGWRGVGVLAAWTAVLGTLAAWAYRRDGFRPSATGGT